jgi:hypothetical protein
MAILDATKLDIYNGALRRIGSRKLASLAENRKPRRVLDDIWGNSDNVVLRALRKGDWNFATRTMAMEYLTDVAPAFGFQRAFEKPADFVSLSRFAADENFRLPLTHSEFNDEAGYWFSDADTIYIAYISSDGSYGFDDTLWPEDFKVYLECLMAFDACEQITNSKSKKAMLKTEMSDALTDSKSTDAMSDGVKFPPAGSWIQSRAASSRRERSRLR